MLIPADLAIFGSVALIALAAAIIAWLILRRIGRDPLRLLDEREWRMAAKLVGIALLGLVLYQASVALQLPAELFIYGRF